MSYVKKAFIENLAKIMNLPFNEAETMFEGIMLVEQMSNIEEVMVMKGGMKR